ncbi:MAG: bile acid:sodium symporter [Rivihabitans pingtungensis]
MCCDLGIAVVFFLHGLGISFASLRQGMLRWPVHLLVQLLTFCRVSAAVAAGRAAGERRLDAGRAGAGLCYLCALPSTISSSVAMTGLARGNVPAAIFNATLSSVLGIALTPLLVAALAHLGGGQGMDLSGGAQHCPPALAAPAGRTTAAPAAARLASALQTLYQSAGPLGDFAAGVHGIL